MFSLSIIRTRKVSLLKKQSEQWKSLYAAEMKMRVHLAVKHQVEKNEFQEYYYKLIQQHSKELFDFQIYKQEQRAILTDQHFREFQESE